MNRNRNWVHQLFAQGDNNNQAARSYTKQFKELLQAVFGVKSYFGDFFAGGLEALDGIQERDIAFSVKTSDVACVVTTGTVGSTGASGAYDTGANVGMGTGTGATSRFGNRTEVIYANTDVPYTWDWVIHEGIDRHTVNNDFDVAVADRLELQAQKKTAAFNAHHGAFIASVAGKTYTYASITKDNVGDVFNDIHGWFVNKGVDASLWVAKVTSAVYNAIVDSGLMVSSKNGTVSEDNQTVNKFKGFVIEEVPDALFAEGYGIYAYAAGVGKAFTGIETARTIESEDFDGVALQGAGKAGEWILPDNKQAVVKVAITGSTGDTGSTGETGA